MEKQLRIEEVALLVGTSTQTINIWYRWKKQNPNNELAKLLPDYQQDGERQTRYWKQSDVWSIQEFKRSIPRGCKGILGDVTQKYRKNRKDK